MDVRCSYTDLVSLKDLKPHPKNRNKHPANQIARLAQIIEYQGIRHPIKVSKRSGYITAGHGRLEALKKLKIKEAPVDYQDYESEEQEYADLQSDNAIALWAEMDLSGINLDVPDLGPDFDIDLLGIKDFVLEPAEKLEAQGDEDEVPEKVEPRSKPGDVYQLGRHRLVCGDSTNLSDVAKLMNGQLADLWLTDPPYGVGMEAREKSSSSWVNKDRKNSQITNDDKSLEEMKQFWTDCATAALTATTDKAAYYWFACQGGDQMMMMMMMSLGDGGWQVKHELMWLKDQMVFGRCDYHYKHEPILYGWKRGCSHEWHGDRKQTSVLEIKRPKKSDLHPTMKPIELLEPLLENSSKPAAKILDLFGGSGSTLIACEKANRKCFMMEIDPHYCDVIVKRWENYTGKTAELLGEEIHKTKAKRRKHGKTKA